MKRKKVVKMRGSKTHGYGAKKKHRGAGSRGGRGRAGTKKHKKLWLLKQGKKLGKRGFKSLKKRKIKSKPRAINLSDLVKLADGKKEIDASKLGFDKVLGKGKIEIGISSKARGDEMSRVTSHKRDTKPITIKSKSFSKKAEEKIKKVGGKAVKIE